MRGRICGGLGKEWVASQDGSLEVVDFSASMSSYLTSTWPMALSLALVLGLRRGVLLRVFEWGEDWPGPHIDGSEVLG